MPSRATIFAVLAALSQVAALPSDSLRPRNVRPVAAPDAAIFARDPAPPSTLPAPASAALDSLARQLASCRIRLDSSDTTVARLRDSLASSRGARSRTDSLRRSDSLLASRRGDTLALVRRFDSLTVQLEELTVSDTSLSANADRFSEALLAAALRSGFSVRRAPLLPGVRNCVGLKAALYRSGDTTWLRLVRLGRTDSVVVLGHAASSGDSGVERMERRALRDLYGPGATPPEPRAPWHWGVRVGILATSALVSLLVMASLW